MNSRKSRMFIAIRINEIKNIDTRYGAVLNNLIKMEHPIYILPNEDEELLRLYSNFLLNRKSENPLENIIESLKTHITLNRDSLHPLILEAIESKFNYVIIL